MVGEDKRRYGEKKFGRRLKRKNAKIYIKSVHTHSPHCFTQLGRLAFSALDEAVSSCKAR